MELAAKGILHEDAIRAAVRSCGPLGLRLLGEQPMIRERAVAPRRDERDLPIYDEAGIQIGAVRRVSDGRFVGITRGGRHRIYADTLAGAKHALRRLIAEQNFHWRTASFDE